MTTYTSVDVNFNGTPEDCFLIETINSVNYLIEKKYIIIDPTLDADVAAFDAAHGPSPKAGNIIAIGTFIISNGNTFANTYHSIIKAVGIKPDTLGAPYDISQVYYSGGTTWKHTANNTAV